VDRDEILHVLRAFEQAGLDYVLIGATAMAFHGVVRATEDIDLFIRATPDNVERLRQAFRAAYDNDPNIEEISTADLLGDYPALRYYPPTGDLYFDVMTRLGEMASFDTVEAETRDVAGTPVRVATPRALYRLKKGLVRAKDHEDAAALATTVPTGGRRVTPGRRVLKFRSIEEMNASRPVEREEADFERFLRHCARYWVVAPRRYPRGVFRFRSIEEAQQARERHSSPAATALPNQAD
jgi:Nucleotidyl transferase AbiEii toxin, Type IV TA system